MFVYDPSLSFVEADEADVVAIHRSTGPVSAAPEGFGARPCNAYVCAIQRGGITRVYVVLEHADRKGRWIFAAPEGIVEGDACLPLLGEGLAFASSLGFAMQEVGLSYSKAMREVVIRDIPVIRRPFPAEQQGGDAPTDAGVPPAADGKKDTASKERKEAAPLGEEEREAISPPRDESEARSLVERLAAENAAAERESRERLAELASRIELLVSERKERDAAVAAEESALRGEIARLTAEKEQAERDQGKAAAALRSTVERLKGELEFLGKGEASAVAALRDEVAWLKAEKGRAGEERAREEERLRAEVERLASTRDQEERAAAKRIESLTGRQEELAARQAAAVKESSARIKELEAEAERRAAETAALEKRAAADIAALEAEIEKRKAEKEAARKLAVGRLVRLAAEVEVLAAEREAVEQVISRRGSGDMAEALARAESETAALRRENERLAAEKALAAQSATARVSSLQAEVARLAVPGESPMPATRHGRGEPVRPEPAAAPPGGAAPAGEASAAVVWDDEVAAAVGEALAEGETDPFGFMGGGGEFVSFGASGEERSPGTGTGFGLDKGLEMIECDGPAEVIEVHGSLNVVNITPAGHTPQPCGAYVIALKRGERYRVHVAWSLTADHSTLVYSPEKQPADAEDCSRLVRDALAFVETVGFMMDAVRLNPDLDKRGRALAKIPVLRLKK